MKKHNKSRSILFGFALLLMMAIFTFTGCPTTQSSAKSAPDEIGNSAVDEATEAVSDNVREEVRDNVNDLFDELF